MKINQRFWLTTRSNEGIILWVCQKLMKYIDVIEKAMLQQKPMKGLNIFNIKNKAQLIFMY